MDEARQVVLDTERLNLREVAEDDWRDLQAIHADPEVTRYWEPPRTAEQTRDWLREATQANRAIPRHSYDFVIVRKADQALVGQIGIGEAECRHHGSLDFGYALAREYWGQGYMTEVLRALYRVLM